MSSGFREIAAKVSNWGRWGDDDERGTTNLITPDAIVAAARLVRTGKVFDLGMPFDANGPQDGSTGRGNPVRMMRKIGTEAPLRPGSARFTDDCVFMPLQAATQYDALSHCFYDGKLYNGFPSSEISTLGAGRCAIDKQSPGIVGRGVLDVAAHRGVEWLAADAEIAPDELDAVAAAAGVDVRSGDILLIRTGWRKKYLSDLDGRSYMWDAPGIGVAVCEWLRDHDVAVICCDNPGVERSGLELDGEFHPVHMIALRDMGLTLGEMFDLEELAADCRDDGVYEFLYCGPPIKFTMAVGSPINPLAIK
jgi:kynurenine formamidase